MGFTSGARPEGDRQIWFQSLWDREDIETALEMGHYAVTDENVARFLEKVDTDQLEELVTTYIWDRIDNMLGDMTLARDESATHEQEEAGSTP